MYTYRFLRVYHVTYGFTCIPYVHISYITHMHACVLYIGGHCRGRPSPVTTAQRPSGSQPETKGRE